MLKYAKPVLINMPERTDRLRDSLRELSWASGRPVTEDDIYLLTPPQFDDAAGFINAGYRSCLHAHLEAAKWGLANGVERLLVFEDDIQFAPDWRTTGVAALEQLEAEPWDLATLGYLPNLGGPEQLGTFEWQRFDGEVIGSHAYVVNGPFLPRWIQHLEAISTGKPGDELTGPISPDGAFNTIVWVDPNIKRFLANPSLVDQRPSHSDINLSRVDKMTALSLPVRLLRRLQNRLRHARRSS